MQKYVDLLNWQPRCGGGIDQFWLTAQSAHRPGAQGDFVDRLRRGVLPVSKRSRNWFAISARHPSQRCRQSAPSPAAGAEVGKPVAALAVGGREGQRETVFALNMDCARPRHAPIAMSWPAMSCDIGANLTCG